MSALLVKKLRSFKNQNHPRWLTDSKRLIKRISKDVEDFPEELLSPSIAFTQDCRSKSHQILSYSCLYQVLVHHKLVETCLIVSQIHVQFFLEVFDTSDALLQRVTQEILDLWKVHGGHWRKVNCLRKVLHRQRWIFVCHMWHVFDWCEEKDYPWQLTAATFNWREMRLNKSLQIQG